jgi:hypothetical protein
MDVHKKSVVVCLLLIDESTGEERKQRRSFGTTTRALLELAAWLKRWGVEMVAMESTGVYWKPAVANRLQKLLEESNIKLSSVARSWPCGGCARRSRNCGKPWRDG